jgi:hypothetical protein
VYLQTLLPLQLPFPTIIVSPITLDIANINEDTIPYKASRIAILLTTSNFVAPTVNSNRCMLNQKS